MKSKLLQHIASITDPALRETCETIPLHSKFDTCPASLGFHHAYEGGLLAHTVEVCDMALGIANLGHTGYVEGSPYQHSEFPKVNHDVLIAAALFHDLLKIEEYAFFWDWPANAVGQKLLAVPGTDESGLRKFWNAPIT